MERLFADNTPTLLGFEITLEIAREYDWSMERTMAELRLTLYNSLDLASEDKTMALDELQEIKDTEENESVLATIHELSKKEAKISLEMSDTWYEIDTLKREYPEIYQALEDDIPEGIRGNDFYKEMHVRLKREFREIWKEL